jgi:hypothetical protein
VDANKTVSFSLGSYDTSKPLTIDPVLTYSTYLGGTGSDKGYAVAVDASGNAYVTGEMLSSAFPTQNPQQGTRAGNYDAFVTKLNAAGMAVVYSTYLGGTAEERGRGIAVLAANRVVVTGLTRSSDFPTQVPRQASLGGGTCGTAPSTYPCGDAFVTQFDLTANSPVYSTYLGGGAEDDGYGVVVDGSGGVYVAGWTQSTTFPTAGAYQNALNGTVSDAFVAKLTLSQVEFSSGTYIVNESTSSVNLTVALSAAASYTVTVGYTTSDSSALAGSDYGATAGTLVFAPGQTSQVITIPILNDTLNEPTESFNVTYDKLGSLLYAIRATGAGRPVLRQPPGKVHRPGR